MFQITYSNSLPTLACRPLALFEVLWQYPFPESTGNNLYRTPPAILRTPSIHTHPRALPGRITYSPSIHPKESEWLLNNFWMYWPGISYAQRDSHYDSQFTKVYMYDAWYALCKGYIRCAYKLKRWTGNVQPTFVITIRAWLLLSLYLKPHEQSGCRYMRFHISDMHESIGDIPSRGLPFHIKNPALKGINCPGFRPLAGLNWML